MSQFLEAILKHSEGTEERIKGYLIYTGGNRAEDGISLPVFTGQFNVHFTSGPIKDTWVPNVTLRVDGKKFRVDSVVPNTMGLQKTIAIFYLTEGNIDRDAE